MATMLVFFPQRVVGAEDAAVQAGALLTAGRPADAEAMASGCAAPECRLVVARALFAQGRLNEAALAAGSAGEAGPLTAYGQGLRGGGLLLPGPPAAAGGPARGAGNRG